MPSIFNNYDPDKVVLTFRGILVVGYANGTFISSERTEDSFSMDVGAQGDVTRVRNRNKTGMVEVTLQAGALTNAALSAVSQEDELFGTGFGPLFLKDLQGSSSLQAAFAWLRRPANMEYSTDASNRIWTFDCSNLSIVGGGFVL